ncbi:ATPase components of ABC transporters with duplicated ATPase domains [Lactococcus lactis subsp. lactis]|uniref:ATPase components of ABC transporters with duplicated ATPase domains n=2 Tax=Lactococcus lactis TaxID=1358 RepID=A0A0B8QNZ1_LACLL|nr:ATPase components of ABC transporters with duplicated ATPase domains [Lactococcus lactis subsp. lactis]
MNTAADTPFLIILIGRNMLIQLTKITKNYDGLPIFDGLDFAVNEGDKMGLIGNNGTGKTSLFKIMIGQISPELGSINKKKN